MARILVLFSHPRLEKSRIQQQLIRECFPMEGVTFHDLYQRYPDYDIDVPFEQKQLLQHDIIIHQHPLYWYSVPPLTKQWLDLVLQHGWAYGATGKQLAGKWWLHALSSGGPEASYTKEGFHGFTLAEFLRPLQRTATLCNMNWLPPFAVQGSHRLDDAAVRSFASDYRRMLELLRDNRLDLDVCASLNRMNEAITIDNPA
jgi:glutathione-regulated potassium-efflux system ancillary protein KefG